jgi:hypothetical protein
LAEGANTFADIDKRDGTIFRSFIADIIIFNILRIRKSNLLNQITSSKIPVGVLEDCIEDNDLCIVCGTSEPDEDGCRNSVIKTIDSMLGIETPDEDLESHEVVKCKTFTLPDYITGYELDMDSLLDMQIDQAIDLIYDTFFTPEIQAKISNKLEEDDALYEG